MAKTATFYDVISPDGFSIHPTDKYKGHRAAVAAFRKWREQYKAQGFYSSVKFGNIPIEDLEDYCEFKPIG